jgi:carbonic anhydrase
MHCFARDGWSRARTGLLLAAVLGASVAAAEPPAMDAAGALAKLKAGNARFAADPTADLPIDAARRQALVSGQNPMAVVLSCADSRVPPEVIFNTGLGDLFVVRTAGEVLDRSVLATLEYGAEHLKTPLLVVMGHEFCGAVKAAADPSRKSMGPNLDFLLESIQPAVARTERTLFNDPLVAAVMANVEQVVDDLQLKSEILKHLVGDGKLQIVGAYYELSSGRVTFSQPVRGGRPAPVRTTQTQTKTRPRIEIQELQPEMAGSERPTPAKTAAKPSPAPPAPAAAPKTEVAAQKAEAPASAHAKPKPH